MIAVGISLFFIADSAYRWLRAPDRRQFLVGRRGWLLWLGSLPVPFIALLRILWYRWAIRNLRRSDYSDHDADCGREARPEHAAGRDLCCHHRARSRRDPDPRRRVQVAAG
ncbi:MAG: hypothetical protein V9H69_13425 [Anaerolineae bacterium]